MKEFTKLNSFKDLDKTKFNSLAAPKFTSNKTKPKKFVTNFDMSAPLIWSSRTIDEFICKYYIMFLQIDKQTDRYDFTNIYLSSMF